LIGEEVNAMILYMAMTSRQCEDPLSAICLARSGTGKSYLMERVALCMPEDSKMENTQFTENSFYYFRREEIRGKIFLIEDLDGAQAVMYPIRELQTKQRISKTVTVKDKSGAMRTVSLVVEGPVSVIGCSTQEAIYEDNANRSLLLHLDDSAEQDARIMDYQRAARASLIDKSEEQEVRKQLQDVQRVLRPMKIVNPFAPLIALPQEVFKPRRTLGLLLGFVEAITFYHQLQREEKADEGSGEIYIETKPEDVEAAFALLSDTLFRKADELSGACRSFHDWLHAWAKKRKAFTGAEVRKDLRIHPRMVQRYLAELSTFGLIKLVGGHPRKGGYSYAITGAGADGLRERIHTSIEQVIAQVREAHTVRSVQVQAQAPAPKRTRKGEGATVRQGATIGPLSH
jgi:predicted transcriptional regulator